MFNMYRGLESTGIHGRGVDVIDPTGRKKIPLQNKHDAFWFAHTALGPTGKRF